MLCGRAPQPPASAPAVPCGKRGRPSCSAGLGTTAAYLLGHGALFVRERSRRASPSRDPVSAAAEPPPAVTRGDEAVRLCREGRGGLVVLGEAKHRLPGVPQRSPSLRVPSSPPAPLLGLTSFRKLCGVTPASALSVPDCIPSPRPPSVWLALCDVTVPLNDVTFLQNGGDE